MLECQTLTHSRSGPGELTIPRPFRPHRDSIAGSSSLPGALNDRAPELIDLIRENYKFKLSERRMRSGVRSVIPPPKPPASILVTGPHSLQQVRTPHFFPRPNDIIPKNAEIFDVATANQQWQGRIDLYREMTLSKAAFLCDTPPARVTRRGSPKSPAKRPRQKSKVLGELNFENNSELVIGKAPVQTARRSLSSATVSESGIRRATGRPLSAQAKRPRKVEKFDALVRPTAGLSK